MAEIHAWLKNFMDSGFDGSDVYFIENNPPWVRPKDMAVRQVEGDFAPSRDDILSLTKGLHNQKNLDAKLEETGHADFAISVGNWRMRANVSYQQGRSETRAVLRVLNDSVPDLSEIGLPLETLQNLITRRSGIILITGITGSGKSTTMASMLMERAKRPEHIITLEDPIEYPLTRLSRESDKHRADIQQVEIGVDAQSFASALRASLRQDPDVIQIGEINDSETADLAIKAAETGHLVFATLHTRSAHLSVENLIDKFPHEMRTSLRKNLAEYLLAVVSQALIPTLDHKRALAYEIMTVPAKIRTHIKDGAIDQIPNEMRTGGREGMVMLNARLLKMVRDKVISKETALENTYDRENLETGRA